MIYSVGAITYKLNRKGFYNIKLRYLGKAIDESAANSLLDDEDILEKLKSSSSTWASLTFKNLDEGLKFMTDKSFEFSKDSLKRKNLILIGNIPL